MSKPVPGTRGKRRNSRRPRAKDQGLRAGRNTPQLAKRQKADSGKLPSDGGDALALYMRKCGGPLLTPKEELALSRSICNRAVALATERLQAAEAAIANAGDGDGADNALLPHRELLALMNPESIRDAKRLRARLLKLFYGKQEAQKQREWMTGLISMDSQAFRDITRLVERNARLVMKIAKRYMASGIPFEDLVQEGNIWLHHAATRYDYRKKRRFSTYAVWWIRHGIVRAVDDKAKLVRIPVHLSEVLKKIHQRSHMLAASLGRPATDKEIAKALDIDVDELFKVRAHARPMVSLDARAHVEDREALEGFVSDERVEHPADVIGREQVSSMMLSALKHLSPTEADVIRRRFGIGGEDEKTLKEIGEHYKLSRERIRQIQERALAKLRKCFPLHRKSAFI